MKNKIIELIRLTALQPENLTSVLSTLIRTLIKENMSHAKIEKVVKEQILSDSFIEKFTGPFKQVFSPEEIKSLVDFFNSPLIKKFKQLSPSLLTPIYEEYRHLILKAGEKEMEL